MRKIISNYIYLFFKIFFKIKRIFFTNLDLDFPENEHFRKILHVAYYVMQNHKKKNSRGILFQKKSIRNFLFLYSFLFSKFDKKKIQIHRFDFFYSSSRVTYENIFTKRVIKLRQVIYAIVRGKFIGIKIPLSGKKKKRKKKHSPSRLPHCWENHFILHRIL